MRIEVEELTKAKRNPGMIVWHSPKVKEASSLKGRTSLEKPTPVGVLCLSILGSVFVGFQQGEKGGKLPVVGGTPCFLTPEIKGLTPPSLEQLVVSRKAGKLCGFCQRTPDVFPVKHHPKSNINHNWSNKLEREIEAVS